MKKSLQFTFTMLCGALLMTGVVAKETMLAGITLGMSREQVIDTYKQPAGRMYAEPPTEIRTPEVTTGTPAPTMPTTGRRQVLPNTLVFVDMTTNNELVIGETTIVKQGASMMSYGMTPTGAAEEVTLPAWAYMVRANSLAIDQELLIFRINATTSLAVTITRNKANGTSRVTNIIVSSYDPLRPSSGKAIPAGNRKTLDDTATSTNVKIGSTLENVLSNYRWSPYIYPFMTSKVSEVDPKAPAREDAQVPISVIRITRSADGTDTISPETSVWESMDPGAIGNKTITFTDGVRTKIGVGFTKNLMILYPDDSVAFTLLEMKVVRIQVGDSVVIPPDPPKPEIPVQPVLPPGGTIPPGGIPPGGTPPPIWN